MCASMFLDPRFQCALDVEDKDNAKKFLIGLHRRIESATEPTATGNVQFDVTHNDTIEDFSLLGDSIGMHAVDNSIIVFWIIC